MPIGAECAKPTIPAPEPQSRLRLSSFDSVGCTCKAALPSERRMALAGAAHSAGGTHANLAEALMRTDKTVVNVDPNDGRVLMVGGWLDNLQSMFF